MAEDAPLANPGPPRKGAASAANAARENGFVAGNFAPVNSESSVEVRTQDGRALPADLRGMLVRVGPNPRFDTRGFDYHPFDGDGMIHAVSFAGGARSQQGVARLDRRWVRTKKLAAALERGWDVFPFGEMSRGKTRNMRYTVDAQGEAMGPANTNVVAFDGRVYALYESDKPYRVLATDSARSNLATVGRDTFGGQLQHPIAAHPKVDQRTRELVAFGYNMSARPFSVGYSVWPAGGGAPATQLDLPLPSPRMMHDCAITQHWTLLFDPNYLFEAERAAAGQEPWVNYLDRPARFGVLPRHARSADELRWIDVAPCGLFHFANAWEEGADRVVVFGCRSKQMRQDEFGKTPETRMHRWVLDVRRGECISETVVSDHLCDFPQVDQRCQGYPSRFVYAVEFESDLRDVIAPKAFPYFRSVLKFDTESLAVAQYLAVSTGGNRHRISEAAFAPSTAGGVHGRDDGYLLVFAHDEKTDRSEVTVLDAKSMTVAARIPMPSRVPYGFHCSFISADDVQHDDERGESPSAKL
jgi:carotenoid cleavage dioxygenase-like enzyme